MIPYQYGRDLRRGTPTTVQFLLNAMNANTATIGQAYAEGVIESYNRQLRRTGLQPTIERLEAPAPPRGGQVRLMPAFLYNPGLVDSWFIATRVVRSRR